MLMSARIWREEVALHKFRLVGLLPSYRCFEDLGSHPFVVRSVVVDENGKLIVAIQTLAATTSREAAEAVERLFKWALHE